MQEGYVPEDTEEDLFLRSRAGDRAAFDRLRQRLDAPTRRFIRRLVGASDAEDDILQDAFIALYLHRRDVNPVSNFRAFLYRIIRNLCYDELRRNGRFKTVPLEGDGEDASFPPLADPRPGPGRRAEIAADLGRIQREIERLPENQRQALILFCEEGLTYEQVAVAMGTSVETVRSRLHLARSAIKKRLPPEILSLAGNPESRRKS
jgi:RNA polymerase sigma-70 factor (ECF subfamily)